MKISYNWLKDYIAIDNISPQEISEFLTSGGLEVESLEKFESIKGGLKGIVIGEVVHCEKHPDADKLSITKVNTGSESLIPIVCGAPNVAAGQKVLVALPGTTLYMGEKSFVINKTKIRGEISEGMICAEDEIGLGTSHEGIMVLNEDALPGTDAASYFDIREDWVFEIGLTPNRTDATSHLGVARDLRAIMNQQAGYNLELNLPAVEAFNPGNPTGAIALQVKDPQACPRYSGLTLDGIKVGESPDWMKNYLLAAGIRSINNIVDITNFVMLETGQPLHAFDADKIKGDTVVVRLAKPAEKFVTLDGIERSLDPDDLMICDISDGMCIAGVFGGEHSGVTSKTKRIFLESASFNPAFIRKTSKRHSLQTDASFRFERGSDPNITVYALKRAALLIQELTGGKIISDVVDFYPEPLPHWNVLVNIDRVRMLIGKNIPEQTLVNILQLLDIKILEENNQILQLAVPTYRFDVRSEVDIIEEILRIYGYNNIEIGEKLNASISFTKKPDPEKIQNTISDMLSSEGFAEIMTNSLTKSSYTEKIPGFNQDENVVLANPLSADLNVMRQSLLFGGMESIAYNLNRQSFNLKLYEFGLVYHRETKNHDAQDPLMKYQEAKSLSIFLTGNKSEENWDLTPQQVDFFYLKSYVNQVFLRVGLNPVAFEISESPLPLFAGSMRFTYRGKTLADFGKLDNVIVKFFDIRQDIFYADINWDNLLKFIPVNDIRLQEIPKYPEVRRDLALLVDKTVDFKTVENIILNSDKNIIKSVGLFDVFEGEKIGHNKKSYAVSIIIQDKKATLTDKQVDKLIRNIVDNLSKQTGAQIR
ncbi:MAG: phenylalanine--tRNA ligase subunit beta [Bacteroidetes bacterium]|nr:phenylalanine--tRNA ligase subunit beta [Bacteroidota bacterium]